MKFLNTQIFAQILGPSFLLLVANNASAQDATQNSPTQAFLLQLPVLLGFVALLYFAVIRPQKNQAAKHAAFISKLSKGDEVVTASGIIGKVVGVTERVITLEISPNTEVKVIRSQVQSYLKDSLGASTTPATANAK